MEHAQHGCEYRQSRVFSLSCTRAWATSVASVLHRGLRCTRLLVYERASLTVWRGIGGRRAARAQVRNKIATFPAFGPQETTSGGKALKYYASVRLDVRRTGSVKLPTGELAGNTVKVKVSKVRRSPSPERVY